jgi:tetratricopeptide (TPR) repeat protein
LRRPLHQAETALRLAQAEPDGAAALAAAVLDDVDVDVDPEAVSVAERALGLVARVRHDLGAAGVHLERAIDVALAAGLKRRVAEARTSLALVLASLGDVAGALEQADQAAGDLDGGAAARLLVQRSLILQRLGRLDQALQGYRRALPALRRAGDDEGEARLLTNRGILHAYRGDYRAAATDLAAAERGHLALGQRLDAARVRHNLGFVAARRGDVPVALRWFDRAEQDFGRLGVSFPALVLDRCETLLAVRLVDEARRAGTAAAVELQAAGDEIDLAEARLLLSQAALLGGDVAEAGSLAALARRAFVDQERSGWAAMARYAGLRASWAGGDDPRTTVTEAEATVVDLVAAKWTVPALDARLIAARASLDAGLIEAATDHLRLASAARFRGPADVRARAWHAEALLRRSRGNRRGAAHALRAGLQVLVRNRRTLGATELRVHAAAGVADLAQTGMGLAFESGQARRVLAWAERFRPGWTGITRPPRPPDDLEVAEHLAELRYVVAQLEEAGFAGQDPGRLLRRQAALESEISRKTRHATPEGDGDEPVPATIAEIARGLGDRALVELVEHQGRLAAVTLVDGAARLHHLCATAESDQTANTLRFALGRLARPRGSAAARRAAADVAAAASTRLDDLVFGPLRRRVSGRPLVLVPTGSLHAVPWSAVPSCRDRPVTVSPSANGWLRATASGPTGGATVVVAGPRLAQAEPEARDVAKIHPGAVVLTGRRATCRTFLRAVDGADLVHVAAHGRVRADNPLLSSLALADGPLTVYDLERLERAPRCLILSACEVGLSAARAGDELMGLVSSLFALGSRTLVASVVAVGDQAARHLMVELHRRLASGECAAEALAGAQVAAPGDEADALSAAGFVSFGAG